MIKRKPTCENCKNWLEAIQLENKINYPGKNEINLNRIKKEKKELKKTTKQ